MRRHVLSVLVLAICFTFIPITSYAKKKKKDRVPDPLLAIVDRVSAGRSNFYLRNAFDTDPSAYLGRFVPKDTPTQNIDDTAAMQTSCSQYISYKSVGGGGVQYDEYFNASTSVSANFGIPALASQGVNIDAGVGHQGGSIVRVNYTLTHKMVATIDDPDAFAQCCEAGQSRCTNLYIGEFLEGTGELFHYSGNGTDVKAGVGVKGVELGVDVKDGVAWQRAVTFPNPVYFAFKTTSVPADLVQTFEQCGDWTTMVPQSTRGQYFTGLSEIMGSERMARDQARRDARTQVVQYLGESIQAGSIELRSTTGALGDLSSRLDQEDFIQTAATGVAELVKDRAWCIEKHETPDGARYSAKVLAFLPNAVEEEAAQAIEEVLTPDGVE